MTVRELIEELRKHPTDMRVVVNSNSEFDEATQVTTVTAFEARGYVSRVYNDTDKVKAHGWVCVE